jgi:dATP pyrophosphohydrolase
VLVVIHTPALDVLLIERAGTGGFWQSVTGSKDTEDESFECTAAREVFEETGLDVCAPGHVLIDWALENVYEIYPQWRHRYAKGVTVNTEHWFKILLPDRVPVTLAPREHIAHQWQPIQIAASLCFSPSNQQAILKLNSD